MVAGQSAHLPVVFKLKDCKGPAGYNVKVTLTGTEDSGQPGFLAVDDTSTHRAWGIQGWKRSTASGWILTTPPGRLLALTNGNNDINFRAWIQAKSGRDVTIGDFTASLTATFEYI
ncbi:fimbrial protein [Escherichia coli]